MRVLTITRALDIMSALIELQPDLVLMDIYMPECSGLELARVIRQQEAYVSLPIVYLSSERDVDKQYEAMSLGGDDFLTKPIEDHRLVRAVRNRAARSRLLHSLVSRDSLTGLLKHTKIKEALETELSRARRQGTPLSYVMLDIDHFKAVNDQYGHLAGDRVIRSLAHLLRQRLRKSDLIGRYGGEEFAVIMPDTSLAQAARVMDDVRAAFSRLRHQWLEQQIRCSFSAGVACFPDHESAEGLAAAADEALYLAKGSGRDRVAGDTADGQRRMPR
jgi:diguanylate cyclase (GGDEF)-like protein